MVSQTSSPLSPNYRFGVFELDPNTGELRKKGLKVKLQGQPVQILLMLLQRPGEVVTREELQRKLWPADTFVDFEQGLNNSIKRLRTALDDDAGSPHFVETLPRRGYRFIGSVNASPVNTPAELPPVPAPPRTAAAPKAAASRTLLSRKIAALVLIAVLLGAGLLYYLRHRSHPLTNSDRIVLADFENKTGDAAFDDTLKQALSVSLGQSPFLNIVSDQKVRSTLKLMGRAGEDPVSEAVAREVCQRTGSSAVFSGSIARLGTQYVVGLNAMDCRTGDILAQTQVETARKEDVLKALDGAAVQLRQKVGESLATVQKDNKPLEQATTASFDALKAYSRGRMLHVAGDDAAAIPFHKRAIELDPNFAIAYLDLSFAYGNLNQVGLANENMAAAYKLRDRASDRERFRIETYYHLSTGDMDQARASSQLWSETYPRDFGSYLGLAYCDEFAGQLDQAAKDLQEALRAAPDSGLVYASLFELYVAANRFDEAKAVYKEAVARAPADVGLHTSMYGLAFLTDDQREMDRQMAWAAGKPGAENAMLSTASDTLAYHGAAKKAREFSRHAVDSARRNDRKERAALWQMKLALREAELGNDDAAFQDVKSGEALALDRDSQISGALALAFTGHYAEAERISNDVAKRYPADSSVKCYWLPSVRAATELKRNDPGKAIEILQITTPCELGMTGPLYPVYLRGEAFLAQHRGAEAVAEFQKVVDNRGVVLNDLMGALAYLGLARASAAEGNAPNARTAYQGFFALWKNADADIPILKQAKAEYAKLQ